jgi:urate oxidase
MLAENSYGKAGIRLVKVKRGGDRHDLKDLEVAVKFAGDFTAAHVEGNNAAVLPTDPMKNTVYALAKNHALDTIEAFALELTAHFVEENAAASRVEVEISERPWERLTLGAVPHPHAFSRPGEERRTTRVTRDRKAARVESGLDGLRILKSAHSGFSGFKRDRFTTLAETEDRIFATAVTAWWAYGSSEVSFATARESVRRTLLETFAEHRSASVQHTLYAMGEAVLAEVADVDEVRLRLPNKHHILVDLSRFGLENRNEVFVATEEPYGLIEATVRRPAVR